MTTVSPDGLAAALTHIVEVEIEEVRTKARPAVQKAGKAAIDTLSHTHPPNDVSGEYSSSWKQTITGDNLSGWMTEVYNSQGEKTRWLEFGHHLWYMGKNTDVDVPPYPHLDAGFQAGKAELEAQLGK